MPAYHVKLVIKDVSQDSRAREFAHVQDLTLHDDAAGAVELIFAESGVSVAIGNKRQRLEVYADFVRGSVAHRRRFGGGVGQMLAKAVGLDRYSRPRVLDATAGLGKDSFVMACLGAEVTMVERSAIVKLLLDDGLDRARQHALECNDETLIQVLGRMRLIEGQAIDHLRCARQLYDVVYLDPMFPERSKSALVKKDMQVFHKIVGQDHDADELLPLAMEKARYRVVVKRPKHAPYLSARAPSSQIKSKSSRYDIYALKALPKQSAGDY